jgi:hypothetical protein
MKLQHLGLASLIAAMAAVSACKKAEAPAKPAQPAPPAAVVSAAPSASAAAPAYAHDAALEVFGYYLPSAPVNVGQYRLNNISLGSEEDFRNWEGGHRLATYGPAMIEFDDTTSAKTTGETGAEGYATTIRVLPDSYHVDSNGVRFSGRDAKLGAVSFQGRFDAHGFAAAKRGDAPQAVVLVGELKVGAHAFPGVKFTWFGGD